LIQRLGALLKWLLLLPVFIIVVLFAVANDDAVRVALNPFDSDDAAMAIHLPLYQLGFALFALGVICGGFVVWNSQRKYRRQAREKGYDAAAWRNRAEQAEKAAKGKSRMLAAPHENAGV
jgi:uncharacterized integral membrane protein